MEEGDGKRRPMRWDDLFGSKLWVERKMMWNGWGIGNEKQWCDWVIKLDSSQFSVAAVKIILMMEEDGWLRHSETRPNDFLSLSTFYNWFNQLINSFQNWCDYQHLKSVTAIFSQQKHTAAAAAATTGGHLCPSSHHSTESQFIIHKDPQIVPVIGNISSTLTRLVACQRSAPFYITLPRTTLSKRVFTVKNELKSNKIK
jgi:hypothetical protein